MLRISGKYRTAVVLLGIIFLAAQFHFCGELNSGPSGLHPCQLCSTAGTAITTQTLDLAVIPVVHRLEVNAAIASLLLEFSSATSPRAPPAS